MRRENIIGILITVSIHLAVIIVLLLTVVPEGMKKQSSSYEFDFTKQDQVEKMEKEIARKKAINDRLEKKLREAGVEEQEVRNLAVDRGRLKDDRGTNADKLYRDAARVQKQYEEIMAHKGDEFIAVPQNKPVEKKVEEEENRYVGPSVLSYQLDGRTHISLPIPAYKCIGAGEVTVIITVDISGNVIDAKVQDSVSSSDGCLRRYAVNAALKSRFTKSPTGATRQVGNIVYSFIAQ